MTYCAFVSRIDVIFSSDTCADAWIEKEVCNLFSGEV